MRRVNYGEHRYECRVSILGQDILLGYFELRGDAIKAERVAATIRQALNCAEVIKRNRSKEISFNINQNQEAA
jgi:hypothetical protein